MHADPGQPRTIVESVVREEWGRVLATLVGHVRDLELAGDVLQDAVVAALEHWPASGVPASPRAWLLQTARRKAIDRFSRVGRNDEAAAAYRRALELTENAAERAFLERRLDRLG